MPRRSTQPQEKEQQPPAAARQPGQNMRRHIPRGQPQACETDSAVGAEYLTRNDPNEAMIRFKEKPSQAVLGFLKDNGFRWSRMEQAWTRPMSSKTGGQDDDPGRRDFRKVVDILRIEKGIGPVQGQRPALQL